GTQGDAQTMSRVASAVRDFVQKRASGVCEYCLKPEIVSTYGFHVDHIIPVAHGGTSDSDNLAWACFECNVAKGRDIASYDRLTDALTPLYNPRTASWYEHFGINGPEIRGLTAIGRVTVRILALNHADQLMIRANLIDAGYWPPR